MAERVSQRFDGEILIDNLHGDDRDLSRRYSKVSGARLSSLSTILINITSFSYDYGEPNFIVEPQEASQIPSKREFSDGAQIKGHYN